MSGIDLTEAVEAAARALFERTMHELGFSPGHEWDKGTPASRHDYVMRARTAIAAAAPLIEAQALNRAADLARDHVKAQGHCSGCDMALLIEVEMQGDNAHITLAAALRDCKASVVLSGYDSPLYAELFDGWHRTELKAPTALSGKAAEHEVLWSNVPLDVQDVLDFGASA